MTAHEPGARERERETWSEPERERDRGRERERHYHTGVKAGSGAQMPVKSVPALHYQPDQIA
jgi:hypothetical protein